MAGKREERKKARFHWLVTSWLIVAAVIIVGVGGIILFMNGLYHKEMRKENARIPQMLESSKDAKWAYAFNGELQTESESQSESQLESDSQSESKLQTESELQLESTEEQSIVSTVIEKEETQTQTQADVSSKAESAHNVVIGDVKSEKPTYVSLVAVGDNLMHYDVSMSGLQADGSFNYDYNFAYVRDIVQAADLAVINQECVIGGDQWGIKDYPCFNVRTEVAAAIANAGFDVVLAATNHVLDIGKVGSLYMVDFFRTNYPQLTLLGIHDSWETRDEIHVIEKNGIKIGMINYTDILMGGCSIDAYGVPLTDEALETARNSDAVLLGAVGGDVGNSRWYDVAPELRPEAGLLKIRKGLGLFANIRPAYLFEQLADACPLKKEIIGNGFDMVIMRELTGGVYFGARSTEEKDGELYAVDSMPYSEHEIRRIAIKGFEIAMKRRKKLVSVDKANVLDTSRLWRKVVNEVAKDYPEVEVSHMLVDNCAMQLVMNPGQFDVVLTENMFGDILSDEASMITGSIGMLSSASLNESKFGLYEPSHGSAPDIAGKDIANPLATILSAAMLLRYSCDLDKEALAVEAAVRQVLADGYRTGDIMSEGCTKVGTTQMGDLVAERIH